MQARDQLILQLLLNEIRAVKERMGEREPALNKEGAVVQRRTARKRGRPVVPAGRATRHKMAGRVAATRLWSPKRPRKLMIRLAARKRRADRYEKGTCLGLSQLGLSKAYLDAGRVTPDCGW
jgi:hypothetical protein